VCSMGRVPGTQLLTTWIQYTLDNTGRGAVCGVCSVGREPGTQLILLSSIV